MVPRSRQLFALSEIEIVGNVLRIVGGDQADRPNADEYTRHAG